MKFVCTEQRCKKKKWLEFSVIYDVFEEIRDSFDFPLLYHVTGPENSRHFLNQSDLKQKLIVDWSHVFPALDDVCVFSLWALIGCSWILPFIWLTVLIILILVYDTPSESALSEKFTRTALSRQMLPGYYTSANGKFFFSFYQVTYHLMKGSSLPLLLLSPKAFRSEGAVPSSHPGGLEDPPAEISLERCP